MTQSADTCRTQLPAEFEAMMREQLGADYEAFADAIACDPVVSIRINKVKAARAAEGGHVSSPFETVEQVPWCTEGRYLKERPSFTLDPLFHAGRYYVQEASSMFLAAILRQHTTPDTPVVALDLCAAPGGKSTLALGCLPEGSLLIANEPIRQRASILAENITKWGSPYSIVTCNYAQDFQPLGEVFDIIVCDAPCSGEGMFRKDENAIAEWSVQNVRLCQERQREILTDIWPTLRPGGVLIYSTCTFNRLEDEDNVQWMCGELGAEVVPLDDAYAGVNDSRLKGAYHFYPHEARGEGFFVCAVRKCTDGDEWQAENRRDTKRSKNTAARKTGKNAAPAMSRKTIETLTAAMLNTEPELTCTAKQDCIIAFPTAYVSLMQQVEATLHTLTVGTLVGTVIEDKKKRTTTLVPDTALALSTSLNKAGFAQLELTREAALSYLHADALPSPPDLPRGYVLLTYEGTPLGFGKNVGNRINNLYPDGWRIRRQV